MEIIHFSSALCVLQNLSSQILHFCITLNSKDACGPLVLCIYTSIVVEVSELALCKSFS